MNRRKLIAGNWKMNLTHKEAEDLSRHLVGSIKNEYLAKVETVLCPPYTALESVGRVVSRSGLKLGAQNLYFENDGAFTGEISARMLKELGCEYVIIGHSERRKFLHETNKVINSKIKKAIEFDIKPILCVGETFQEREDEIFEGVVDEQLSDALEGISMTDMRKLVIAYEPVWAIGTGLCATTDQASSMHIFIANVVTRLYDSETADKLIILYGGSVNSKNAAEILSAERVDGALVGGASLKADEFTQIVQCAFEISK